MERSYLQRKLITLEGEVHKRINPSKLNFSLGVSSVEVGYHKLAVFLFISLDRSLLCPHKAFVSKLVIFLTFFFGLLMFCLGTSATCLCIPQFSRSMTISKTGITKKEKKQECHPSF